MNNRLLKLKPQGKLLLHLWPSQTTVPSAHYASFFCPFHRNFEEKISSGDKSVAEYHSYTFIGSADAFVTAASSISIAIGKQGLYYVIQAR
jgi:hypothetical protein